MSTDAYARSHKSRAEECGCAMCRNLPLKATAYPTSLLQLLAQLGIDPTKEGEVYYLFAEKAATPLWRLVLLLWRTDRARTAAASEDGISYSSSVQDDAEPLSTDAFGPHPIALDFYLEIPWVLPDSEDPETTIYSPNQRGADHER